MECTWREIARSGVCLQCSRGSQEASVAEAGWEQSWGLKGSAGEGWGRVEGRGKSDEGRPCGPL